MTVYPRRAKTSHADVFPVPGVPVTAMSTAGTIRLVVKVLAPRRSAGEAVGQPTRPNAIPDELADHRSEEVHGKRQHEHEDREVGDEERDPAGVEEIEPGEARGGR